MVKMSHDKLPSRVVFDQRAQLLLQEASSPSSVHAANKTRLAGIYNEASPGAH